MDGFPSARRRMRAQLKGVIRWYILFNASIDKLNRLLFSEEAGVCCQ